MTSAVLTDELLDDGWYYLAGVGEVSRDEWYSEVGLRSTPDLSVALKGSPRGPGFDQSKGHHELAPGGWIPVTPKVQRGRLPNLDEIEGNPE